MTNPIQAAQDRFAQGFNCAQAVFSAYAPAFGIPDEAALKLAAPLGGGTARQGEVCGAVTGALMSLGLKRGSATIDKKDETYHMAKEFVKRFQERHGTIICRELIGHNISTPDGLQSAREQGIFRSVCPAFVRDATELVTELLDE